MENVTKIIGYHTCKTNGGWNYIWNQAPFLSEPNKRQWLTQGYYFWTDSDYFAHKWGEHSIAGSNYAIVECMIGIERNLLLDLVGSLKDQIFFDKLLNLFHERLKKADPNARTPSVNAVLTFYRKKAETNNSIFPFVAIKSADKRSEISVNFTDNGKESMPLITRQQLCLFKGARNRIITKTPIYPDQFKSAIK